MGDISTVMPFEAALDVLRVSDNDGRGRTRFGNVHESYSGIGLARPGCGASVEDSGSCLII